MSASANKRKRDSEVKGSGDDGHLELDLAIDDELLALQAGSSGGEEGASKWADTRDLLELDEAELESALAEYVSSGSLPGGGGGGGPQGEDDDDLLAEDASNVTTAKQQVEPDDEPAAKRQKMAPPEGWSLFYSPAIDSYYLKHKTSTQVRRLTADEAAEFELTKQVEDMQVDSGASGSGSGPQKASVFARLSKAEPPKLEALPAGPKEITPEFIWTANKKNVTTQTIQFIRDNSMLALRHQAPAPTVPTTIESPNVATMRAKMARRHRALFDLHIRELGLQREPDLSYERWFMVQRFLLGNTTSDPVIPDEAVLNVSLAKELIEVGVKPVAAVNVCRSLAAEATSCIASVKKEPVDGLGEGNWATETVKIIKRGSTQIFTWKDTKIHVQSDYVTKLKNRYTGPEEYFTQYAFILLARYEAMGGGSYQSALTREVFRVLEEHLGVTHECFASPLNVTLQNYCSAQYNVDFAFGSSGDFFNFFPTSGSFEANPPFVEEVMKAMVEHMENLLSATEEPLSFAVFVPAWTDTPAWEMMKASVFLRVHILIRKREHYYLVGEQHKVDEQEKYWRAPFGTGIFVLQNAAALEKWHMSDAIIQTLEKAFYEW